MSNVLNALLVGSAHYELVCLLISPLPYENRHIFPSYIKAVKVKYKMKCSTCKWPYICDHIRIFLVVRSHTQTHEQNIQISRQSKAGKMMVLGRHETCK